MAALARGGRTNFFGFLLRLAARIPFLFLAGRLYGDDMLGRFAAALVVVELASQIAVLGQKRGLAQQLSEGDTRPPSHIVADAMVLSLITSIGFTALLLIFPGPMFPNGSNGDLSWLLPLTILPYALTEVALAACAYRYDIGATVRSRALAEPWTISIAVGALFFVVPDSGLELAYVLSVLAAAVVAFMPAIRHYGMPEGWSPHPVRMFRLAMRNLPLAGADAIEWGTRKLDLAILAQFASPSQVGVYFAVQQVATLPQKLKTSFDPILGPVITAALKVGDRSARSASGSSRSRQASRWRWRFRAKRFWACWGRTSSAAPARSRSCWWPKWSPRWRSYPKRRWSTSRASATSSSP